LSNTALNFWTQHSQNPVHCSWAPLAGRLVPLFMQWNSVSFVLKKRRRLKDGLTTHWRIKRGIIVCPYKFFWYYACWQDSFIVVWNMKLWCEIVKVTCSKSDHLTPKVPWLCIHQKRSQIAISSTTTKFLEFFFLTHLTIGSCSMMNRQYVVKLSENSTMWIVRYKHFKFTKTIFFNFAKKRAAALHKLTFQWKNVKNGGDSLNSVF